MRVAFSAFRQLERLPGSGTRPSTASVSTAGAETSTSASCRDDLDWAPLGAGVEHLRQPDDVSRRAGRQRTGGRRRIAHPRGAVAVDVLLLPRGTAPPGVSVVVPPARAGRALARGRGVLPGVRGRLGEPRHGGARGRAVLERRAHRRRRARLRARRAGTLDEFRSGALLRAVRREAAGPVVKLPAGALP